MPKLAKALGPLAVNRLTTPGLHAVGEVPGLCLQVTATGARTWILRVLIGTKRREIGLGGFPAVTLADARTAARREREKIKAGIDPVEQAQAARSALKASQAGGKTFEDCAVAYIKAHAPGWKNVKHHQQWENTLATYAYPLIGSLQVRHVAQAHIIGILEQAADSADPSGPTLWTAKTETATRLRGRLESVLDWAKARGYRDGENPARWRGYLDKLLPKPAKIAKVEHHAALPIGDVSAFMLRLRSEKGTGARALEFAILTAARSGEVRGATWAEIDEDAKIWTVPGSRMKAGNDHRVPLSDAALDLLVELPRTAGSDLVFPAPRGGQLSDMTLTAVLRRLEVPAVPHGFRSTFRDWVSECTSYPREAAEMALAHTIGDKVEAAYRRGDLFEKRRQMMSDWAAFLARSDGAAKVVSLQRRQA